jgi:putative RNA 2'-phosphotransferase
VDRRIIRASKFMSYVLRHDPDSIGLSLDESGWAELSDLLRCADRASVRLSQELIDVVLSSGGKQRFSLSGDGRRIRANYGHSLPIEVDLEPGVPPPLLFHGTAVRFLDSISKKGLAPRGRQYVHLCRDRETAMRVGRRHGPAVVLTVDTRSMLADGGEFLEAPDGVWLTRSVPVAFIRFPEDPESWEQRAD